MDTNTLPLPRCYHGVSAVTTVAPLFFNSLQEKKKGAWCYHGVSTVTIVASLFFNSLQEKEKGPSFCHSHYMPAKLHLNTT